MLVIDASVAMKWFIREVNSNAALSLLTDGPQMVAPWIMRLEVTNGLMRRYREEILSEDDTRVAVAGLDRVITEGALQLMPNEELWDSAVGLAFKIKHPPADCLYLALGKAIKATVITSDKTLVLRAAKSGAKTMLLDDYCKHIAVS